jgi:hypothetical protein
MPYDLIVRAVYAIYRGINPEYRSQYGKTIWQQMETRLAFYARQRSVELMLSGMARKLQSSLGYTQEDFEVVKQLSQSEQSEILRICRQETAYIIAMVRLMHQEWKEQHGSDPI